MKFMRRITRRDFLKGMADVSYPCFTTTRGNRVELREGLWNGTDFDSNLKLINVPVLKTHRGTGITGVLKHSYGILSMADGSSPIRHYLNRAPNVVKCGAWLGRQI